MCFGCDDSEKPSAPKSRSQQVLGTGKPAASTKAPMKPPSSASPKKPERKLCDGKLSGPKPFPSDKPIDRAAASGATEVPPAIPVGGGKWTWINFWAAWCVPCKEEMPRLLEWEKRSAKDGVPLRLVFVSTDDDQRQLDEFLKKQPASGVKASYWLKEGEQRQSWLTAAGMGDDPELPAHLLVDPSGKVRCSFEGAVEDSDYAQVVSLLEE